MSQCRVDCVSPTHAATARCVVRFFSGTSASFSLTASKSISFGPALPTRLLRISGLTTPSAFCSWSCLPQPCDGVPVRLEQSCHCCGECTFLDDTAFARTKKLSYDCLPSFDIQICSLLFCGSSSSSRAHTLQISERSLLISTQGALLSGRILGEASNTSHCP